MMKFSSEKADPRKLWDFDLMWNIAQNEDELDMNIELSAVPIRSEDQESLKIRRRHPDYDEEGNFRGQVPSCHIL